MGNRIDKEKFSEIWNEYIDQTRISLEELSDADGELN